MSASSGTTAGAATGAVMNTRVTSNAACAAADAISDAISVVAAECVRTPQAFATNVRTDVENAPLSGVLRRNMVAMASVACWAVGSAIAANVTVEGACDASNECELKNEAAHVCHREREEIKGSPKADERRPIDPPKSAVLGPIYGRNGCPLDHGKGGGYSR